MRNVIDKLLNTRKSLEEVIEDSPLDADDILQVVDTCSNCSKWVLKKDMLEDNSGFPICKVCMDLDGPY